jgi:hypothetical protein
MTILTQNLNEIHTRILNGSYACLSALLAELKAAIPAHDVGVFAVVDGRIVPRRFSADTCRLFAIDGLDKIVLREVEEKSLQDTIVGDDNDDPEMMATYSHNRLIPLTGNYSTKFLLLRRIWPDSQWRIHESGSTWAYVFSPMTLTTSDDIDYEPVKQIGDIFTKFISWKWEQRIRRRDALLSPARIVEHFRLNLVRPFTRGQFFRVLQRISSHVATPQTAPGQSQSVADTLTLIDDVARVCREPRCGCDSVRSRLNTGFKCPQLEFDLEAIPVLAGLEKFRISYAGRASVACTSAQRFHQDFRSCFEKVPSILLGDQEAVSGLSAGDRIHGSPSNRRALTGFFVAFGIQAVLGGIDDCVTTPPPDLIDLAVGLASISSFLIGGGNVSESVIIDMIRIVSLFGHYVLLIPLRLDLRRHLEQTLRGESALHTLKSRYRDHFFHTLEVCFLGLLILSSRHAGNDATFAAHIARVSSGGAHPSLANDHLAATEMLKIPEIRSIYAQWWVASLLHDTAYGIDIFHGTLELLKFFQNRPSVETFANAAKGAVAQMTPDLESLAPELKGDPGIRKGDHGLIAAASLASVLDNIGPNTRARFNSSVRAIAFHNTRFPRIDAKTDPIAALLILCDSIQEWGRASIGYYRSPSLVMSRLVESAEPSKDEFGPVERFELGLVPQPSSGAGLPPVVWAQPGVLKIKLEYSNAILRGCGAKFSMADLTYNLQRVDFRAWGVQIEIHLQFPFPTNDASQQSGRSQLQYMRQFVDEQRVNFIEDWVTSAEANSESSPVRHQLGTTPPSAENPIGAETFIFNLTRMSEEFCNERPVMAGTIGDFLHAMQSWSEFQREQSNAPPVHRPPV